MRRFVRLLVVGAVVAFALLADVAGPCCWLELCCPPFHPTTEEGSAS